MVTLEGAPTTGHALPRSGTQTNAGNTTRLMGYLRGRGSPGVALVLAERSR